MYDLNFSIRPPREKRKHTHPQIPVVCSDCGYILGYVDLCRWEVEIGKFTYSRCPKCHRFLKNPKPVVEIKNNGDGDNGKET